MCVKWPNMPEKVIVFSKQINNVFISIFTIEAVIKLLGFGKRYFKFGWNMFDFTIVVASAVALIIES